jgi:hypothetical protein
MIKNMHIQGSACYFGLQIGAIASHGTFSINREQSSSFLEAAVCAGFANYCDRRSLKKSRDDLTAQNSQPTVAVFHDKVFLDEPP